MDHGEKAVFQGIGKGNQKLIVGIADIYDMETTNTLSGQIRNFLLIRAVVQGAFEVKTDNTSFRLWN
ncbi:MAG: hypothetical protein GX663_09305 [Clostridiales bacterium]|nr:hypothetical protein [Clostridiales bacterium]